MLFREKEPAGKPGGDNGPEVAAPLYPGMTPDELRAALAFAEKKLQLVGSVTRHDVLNQLTAIVGYNELLGMMIEDPKLKSFLEKERSAVDKIRRQFQFAKDYQNIGANPPAWFPLRQIVRESAEEADLGIIRVEDMTGPVSVLADPQFPKVIKNLFENTRRHGNPASMIRITLRDGPGPVVLVIEDNGPGIAPADKVRIFERGFGKGTGWGLFLVREILLFCGMTIAETGEPGNGARFEITIPPEKIRRDA
jgi:signal transduction histidine kinase